MIWKDIPSYGGFQVSNTSKVRRLAFEYTDSKGRVNHIKESELKTSVNKKGYLRVELCIGSGKKKPFTIHRLVILAFKGLPPDGFDQINHIDGNKLNNNPDNLEWSNNSHNIKHAWAMGLFKPVLPKGVMFGRAKPVIHIEYGIFFTIIEAAKTLNITRKRMSDMLENKIINTSKFHYA